MQTGKQGSNSTIPASVVTAGVGPLNVLVAEDSKASQLILKLILNKLGHSVLLADDGVAAVERARAGGVDLIIMDVQMPILDGLSATTMIRRQAEGGRRVPILALTANDLEADRMACLQAGMDDVITKPVERDLLQQKLADLALC